MKSAAVLEVSRYNMFGERERGRGGGVGADIDQTTRTSRSTMTLETMLHSRHRIRT
jgi:hypothetical protein